MENVEEDVVLVELIMHPGWQPASTKHTLTCILQDEEVFRVLRQVRLPRHVPLLEGGVLVLRLGPEHLVEHGLVQLLVPQLGLRERSLLA